MELQPQDMHEALLMYTHAKIEIVQCIKNGISYSDLIQFEEKLEKIDRVLRRTEKELENKIKLENRQELTQ